MAVSSSQPAKRGYFIDELTVGMTASFRKLITDADVVAFAGISGDDNPVHLDEDYARETHFGGRIVHGILSAGLISAAIAGQLPGPGTIYLRQSLKFCAPVRIGDMVEARVTVTEINTEKNRVMLGTVCSVGEEMVIEGDALVLPPKRPA